MRKTSGPQGETSEKVIKHEKYGEMRRRVPLSGGNGQRSRPRGYLAVIGEQKGATHEASIHRRNSGIEKGQKK